MTDVRRFGSLDMQPCEPSGIRFGCVAYPQELLIDDVLIQSAERFDHQMEVAGDEVCFFATNGRALYRRSEYDLASMTGRYVLVGSVGPS